MINSLALNLLADVMNWDTEEATSEYEWLRLISSMKYDGYADFRAGVRFLESLVSWLRNFDEPDRASAYQFVKSRLVYISTLEMQRVIEAFFPETVTPYLRGSVGDEYGIKSYEVWKTPETAAAFKHRLRRCLFVGLSDGSRIDVLRRANAGRISQDQVVPMMNVDNDKWKSLTDDLERDLGENVRFGDVYLIDDFTASGTTFVRFPEGKAKGKLQRFEKMVQGAKKDLKTRFPLADDYTLHIHHYVSTTQAHDTLEERVAEADTKFGTTSFGEARITEGVLLPLTLRLASIDKKSRRADPTYPSDAPIADICSQYYNHDLYKRLEKHCREAGQTDMKFGYADCALPLVLEHNTPNNSIPLLWAEVAESDGREMQPLFFRRDRHG